MNRSFFHTSLLGIVLLAASSTLHAMENSPKKLPHIKQVVPMVCVGEAAVAFKNGQIDQVVLFSTGNAYTCKLGESASYVWQTVLGDDVTQEEKIAILKAVFVAEEFKGTFNRQPIHGIR